MTMYKLRETMCLINSARQVRRYYFKQMSAGDITSWWKKWDRYFAKLDKIRVNLLESTSVKSKYSEDIQKHHEANLKLYKISGEVMAWYKKDKAMRESHEFDMQSGSNSYANLDYMLFGEMATSDEELDCIFKNGLDDIAGEPGAANSP